MAIDFQAQNGFYGPNAKGTQTYLRASDFGEQVTLPGGSDYQELNRQGQLYVAKSGAAAAIPVQSALTNSPTLWNPASSGKVLIPCLLQLSVAAVGTPVLSGLTVSWLKNTGDTVATGLPLATFTNIAPVGLTLGHGASQARFANAAVTFTTNPTLLLDTGMNHWLEGTAATGLLINAQYDFKGSIIMPPGTSISVGSITATSTTYWTSIIFAEVPAYLYYNN
jgi:hypothetical protein